jgi:hypothetical protein
LFSPIPSDPSIQNAVSYWSLQREKRRVAAPVNIGDLQSPATSRYCWARRARVRKRDLTAPGDKLGRAVITIGDAFNERRPVAVSERDLNGFRKFLTIGSAHAAATTVLRVEPPESNPAQCQFLMLL